MSRTLTSTITEEKQNNRSGSKSTAIASLAALGSVILSSSCCLPLLPFVLAAGTAGSSSFFVKLRPYLVIASILFIAFGFYQSWKAKQCKCRPGTVSTVLLWFSAIVVVVFTFFPQAMANFVADVLAR